MPPASSDGSDCGFRKALDGVERLTRSHRRPTTYHEPVWRAWPDIGPEGGITQMALVGHHVLYVVQVGDAFLKAAPDMPKCSWSLYEVTDGQNIAICGGAAADLEDAKAKAESIWRAFTGRLTDS